MRPPGNAYCRACARMPAARVVITTHASPVSSATTHTATAECRRSPTSSDTASKPVRLAVSRARNSSFALYGTARPYGVGVDDEPTITLERWTGPWGPDDPDANFKAEVALYATTDPLGTITNLATNIGVPVGAIARYVLCRWATGGSGAALEFGPTMTARLAAVCRDAESAGTDAARLAAYDQLRQMIQWLALTFTDEAGY